jgi:hypothetical protein
MTLFSRNVRLSAGKTRINKELASTVADDRSTRTTTTYSPAKSMLTSCTYFS